MLIDFLERVLEGFILSHMVVGPKALSMFTVRLLYNFYVLTWTSTISYWSEKVCRKGIDGCLSIITS